MRNCLFYSIILCATAFPVSAQAGAMLDQSFDPSGYSQVYADVKLDSGDYAQEAQSFQVGIGGRLTQADLLLQGTGYEVQGNLELQLRRTNASGLPSDSPADVLAVANLAESAVPARQPGFVAFNFGPDAPLVKTGDLLSLVLIETVPGSGLVDWIGTSGNRYGLGQSLVKSHLFYHDNWAAPDGFNGGLDLGFKTYVEPVPEPSSLLLAASMAGACLWLRHRRCPRRPVTRVK
jgi:hypothetical protein